MSSMIGVRSWICPVVGAGGVKPSSSSGPLAPSPPQPRRPAINTIPKPLLRIIPPTTTSYYGPRQESGVQPQPPLPHVQVVVSPHCPSGLASGSAGPASVLLHVLVQKNVGGSLPPSVEQSGASTVPWQSPSVWQ